MEEEYTITQEIKSETRVGAGLYAFDFFFLLVYGIVTYILANIVHDALVIPFYIFSLLMAIFLTMPSIFNRKRRNYQTIIIYLRKDNDVFRPVKNVSKMLHYKDKDDENRENNIWL